MSELELVPDPTLESNPNCILLSAQQRLRLGVVIGQRIQFHTGTVNFVLQVLASAKDGPARVAPNVWSSLNQEQVEVSVPPITLGCDPEFFLLERGRFSSAATYLPFQGPIGADGGLGELRPAHGTHEDQVIHNLRELIRAIPTRLPVRSLRIPVGAGGTTGLGKVRPFSFEAHSYNFGLAAGFHVHFGLPPELLHARGETSRITLDHLVRALDWYVSVALVPLEPDLNRRCGGGRYGLPGDYRQSNVTLEYRTPGGFYLRSPILAGGLLSLSLLVAETFIDRLRPASRNFLNLSNLTSGDLNEILPIPRPEIIRHTLLERDKSTALRAYPKILDQIRKLPKFSQHQGAIGSFIREVEAGSLPSPDLSNNWRTQYECFEAR